MKLLVTSFGDFNTVTDFLSTSIAQTTLFPWKSDSVSKICVPILNEKENTFNELS
jgi:hypothetical protein